MTVWMVGTVTDTVKRVEAERYAVSDGYLSFYTEAQCIACFAAHQWVYLMKDKPAEIPMCNPKLQTPGVIG